MAYSSTNRVRTRSPRWCGFTAWWAMALITAGAPLPAQAQPPLDHAPTTATGPSTHESDRQANPAMVEVWLDRIEQRSEGITTLQAALRYDRVQGLVGDRQRRFGHLTYVAGPPAQFVVWFDRLLVDRRLDQDDRRYIFDGQWLVERYAQDQIFIKRQVVPPPVEGQTTTTTDLLALGQGPVALPVTQRKDELLRRFVVTLRPTTDEDPSHSIHLHLVPKDGEQASFTEADLWYDRQLLLPVRVRTIDDSENESIIDLTEHKVNQGVAAGVVDTSEPTQPGWRVEVVPWDASSTQPKQAGD